MDVRKIEHDDLEPSHQDELLTTILNSSGLEPALDWCMLVACMFMLALVFLDAFPGLSNRQR